MQFIRINSKNHYLFKDAMKIYNNSFPIFEQRTLENQMEALKNPDYYCTVICDKNKLVGLLFYWQWNIYQYVEHLAIAEDLRGQNYGSRILKEFCKINKLIILEIDPPIDDISLKRLNFYAKLGFKMQSFEHVHPPYRKDFEGHKLKVLSYNTDLNLKEYNDFNDFLCNTIMKFSECTN